jgi:hypothetical protein
VLVVEALNANGQPIDSSGFVTGKAVALDSAGIGLQSNFNVIFKTDGMLCVLNDSGDSTWRK